MCFRVIGESAHIGLGLLRGRDDLDLFPRTSFRLKLAFSQQPAEFQVSFDMLILVVPPFLARGNGWRRLGRWFLGQRLFGRELHGQFITVQPIKIFLGAGPDDDIFRQDRGIGDDGIFHVTRTLHIDRFQFVPLGRLNFQTNMRVFGEAGVGNQLDRFHAVNVRPIFSRQPFGGNQFHRHPRCGSPVRLKPKTDGVQGIEIEFRFIEDEVVTNDR